MNDYASFRFENKDLEVSKENLKYFTSLMDQVLTLGDKKSALESENEIILDVSMKGIDLANNA